MFANVFATFCKGLCIFCDIGSLDLPWVPEAHGYEPDATLYQRLGLGNLRMLRFTFEKMVTSNDWKSWKIGDELCAGRRPLGSGVWPEECSWFILIRTDSLRFPCFKPFKPCSLISSWSHVPGSTRFATRPIFASFLIHPRTGLPYFSVFRMNVDIMPLA